MSDRYSDVSEAEEVAYLDEVEEEHEEEAEGEDLMDTFARDYDDRPDLDVYDEDLIDDADYDVDAQAVARAERELSRRDAGTSRMAERHSRFYALQSILQRQEEEEEVEDEDDEAVRRRPRLFASRVRVPAGGAARCEAAKEEIPFPDPNVSMTDRTRDILNDAFTYFLWFHDREGDNYVGQKYVDAVESMAETEQTSLAVSWTDMNNFSLKLTDWLTFHPSDTLSICDRVLTSLVREHFPDLRAFRQQHFSIRIKNYNFYEPLDSLRVDVVNQLVAVECVCVRRSVAQPRLKAAVLICTACGYDSNGPFEKKITERDIPKRRCVNCQSRGPFFINKTKSTFVSHQHLTVQELPGHVSAGQVPRQKQVVVSGDLVDSVRPGEEIVVMGTYATKVEFQMNARVGFPVFGTHILANNIEKNSEKKVAEMTEKEIRILKQLSRQPNIRDRLVRSIAPSIWGHRHVKTGIAMALFGGVRQHVGSEKETQESAKHNIRGDINVLLVGDPGLAKSQFLKYCQATFDRTVLTSGKGASAAGLTAAMKKDPVSGEWSLEGGALVLADDGICLIDEFDKMTEKDRVSMHEAMAQQTISISKAGICTTLRARCSVVAAANPKFGRYDSQMTFLENVDLGDTLLSRFDVVAVMRDNPSPIHDEYLAQYILNTHCKSHPYADPEERMANQAPNLDDLGWLQSNEPLPHEVLRKYVVYARNTCHPRINKIDKEKVVDFYTQLRQAAMRSGGLPLTVRHLESILRMACANAKMRLSPVVSSTDFDFAISTMLESFIQSQKHAVATNLCKRFGRYRAIANSSTEVLETLITDLLRRKAAFVMSRIRVNAEDDAAAAYLNHFQDVTVRKSELEQLASALYGLPAVSVDRFLARKNYQQQTLHGEVLISTAYTGTAELSPVSPLSPGPPM